MTKTTVVSLFALSLIALTGIGYATFTSTATIYGNANAGNLVLAMSNFNNGVSTPSGYGSCDWQSYVAGPPAYVTLTVSNMAPGDSCSAWLTINNVGSLPMTSESSTFAAGSGYWCTSGGYTTNCFYVTDSLSTPLESYFGQSGSQASTVAPGNTFSPYYVTVYYASGSTTQNAAATFTITFTGSVGS
jgi:hypothetical protein